MRCFTSAACSYAKIVEIPASEILKFDFAVCSEPRETLASYYNRQTLKPDVLINGGLFSMTNGNPCFNYVDEGIVKASNGWTKKGIGIKKTDASSLCYGNIDDGGWKDFVSGYPVLLDGGTAKTSFDVGSEINYAACRSMIGWTASKGTYYVVTISKPGMTFVQMSKFMYGIGCRYAINLDGGGSTRMMVRGSVVNVPTENRAVDNVVAIYLKASTTSTTATNTTAYTTYTVVSGDSLSKIALNKLGSSSKYTEIMTLNSLTSTIIHVGQVLKIPSSTSTTTSSYTTYTVVKGDSWWSIASKKLNSGLRYKELATYNGLTITTALKIGQVLKIPA